MKPESSEWEWERTSVLLKDGTWLHDTRLNPNELRKFESDFHEERYPYSNIIKNGKSQSCLAKVQVWEREWRWNGISKISKDIEVSFSEELGSDAGSWKGGVVGCHYEISEGETPLQTLRRMQTERQFK